jgi:hypothetical protein
MQMESFLLVASQVQMVLLVRMVHLDGMDLLVGQVVVPAAQEVMVVMDGTVNQVVLVQILSMHWPH